MEKIIAALIFLILALWTIRALHTMDVSMIAITDGMLALGDYMKAYDKDSEIYMLAVEPVCKALISYQEESLKIIQSSSFKARLFLLSFFMGWRKAVSLSFGRQIRKASLIAKSYDLAMEWIKSNNYKENI